MATHRPGGVSRRRNLLYDSRRMAMKDKTYLTELETARTAILTGAQAATVGDMSYTLPTLSVLIDEINRVKKRLARASGARPFVTSIRVGGMGY